MLLRRTNKPVNVLKIRASLVPTCIPDNHPQRVTNTKCHIDTVISPDDGHIVARNTYRKERNILSKIVHQVGLIYKIIRGCTVNIAKFENLRLAIRSIPNNITYEIINIHVGTKAVNKETEANTRTMTSLLGKLICKQ